MKHWAWAGTAVLALAACLGPKPEPTPTGAMDFATFCAACHGTDGRGAGAVSATLSATPADLTALPGGKGFPGARVMSKIYGYTGDSRGLMPGFADLLEGETVLYDSGDGIATPTPLRLVQLAEHVKALGG